MSCHMYMQQRIECFVPDGCWELLKSMIAIDLILVPRVCIAVELRCMAVQKHYTGHPDSLQLRLKILAGCAHRSAAASTDGFPAREGKCPPLQVINPCCFSRQPATGR